MQTALPVSETATTVALLDEMFGADGLTRVGFRLWDGTRWPDDSPRQATLVLHHPGALRAMFAGGTEKALAEAYLYDDFDIEGNLEAAFQLADLVNERETGWLDTLRTYLHLRRLPDASHRTAPPRHFGDAHDRMHSVPRDREAVSFHYDVSNDFYRLWLDERMVYSCAYFTAPDRTLDEAQTAKLEHLCRKLRLEPGQRLLDVGCGWGGLALYAAQHHGAQVTGVTLSHAQAELAAARVREAGLQNRVRIELRDYREVRGTEFDAIVSVGMAEHVGRTHLAGYFRHLHGLLRPGGVLLNHAIGEGFKPRRRTGPSFIDTYVFPDSDIPPIPLVVNAAAAAGFEIRDVENLREHYALTLRHWVNRLEANHERALRYVNEPTYRIWRLYMAGSAHGFERGHLAVYQTLLAKPAPDGHARLPLTRADWYRPV